MFLMVLTLIILLSATSPIITNVWSSFRILEKSACYKIFLSAVQ